MILVIGQICAIICGQEWIKYTMAELKYIAIVWLLAVIILLLTELLGQYLHQRETKIKENQWVIYKR